MEENKLPYIPLFNHIMGTWRYKTTWKEEFDGKDREPKF
jgi:hypothetical protein